MTVTITLNPETQRGIDRKAARLGISPGEYLSRLAERAVRPRRGKSSDYGGSEHLTTAAETLEEFVGAVHGTQGPHPGMSWSYIEAACDEVVICR